MFHRDVFLVCPMKSAPVLLRKKAEEEDYDHISLPTQGEVNDAAAAAVVVVAVVVVVVVQPLQRQVAAAAVAVVVVGAGSKTVLAATSRESRFVECLL